jgi:hypothetical protein
MRESYNRIQMLDAEYSRKTDFISSRIENPVSSFD